MSNTFDAFALLDLMKGGNNADASLIAPSGDDLYAPERIERQLEEGVARGQVWLASGEAGMADGEIDETMYVMIVEVDEADPRLATVIPLSNDLRAQTDDALVIERGAPLGRPMVAWPKVPALIPVRLLCKPLKQFAPATVDAIVGDDSTAAAPGDVLRRGEGDGREVSPFVQTREDVVALLLAWHVACADLPKLRSDEQRWAMDSSRAEYARALVRVLGLSFADAEQVIDGKLALDRAQERRLTEAGVDPERFRPRSFHLPEDLLIEVEQPLYWRIARDRLSGVDGAGAGDPRVSLAKEAFMLAARKSGYGRESWRGVLRNMAYGIHDVDEAE